MDEVSGFRFLTFIILISPLANGQPQVRLLLESSCPSCYSVTAATRTTSGRLQPQWQQSITA